MLRLRGISLRCDISPYAATKAFDLVLAEGLHVELKEAGVDVLALAPGFTATDLSGELDSSGTPIRPMPVEPVVQAALRGLGRKAVVVPGWQNRLLVWMGKHLLPRSANTVIFGKIYETLRTHIHHGYARVDIERLNLIPSGLQEKPATFLGYANARQHLPARLHKYTVYSEIAGREEAHLPPLE